MRRAVTWTLLFSGILVQGWMLVRFSSAGMAAFIRDPATFSGRWWHQNEPLFAMAGYATIAILTFLLALAWTKALRAAPAKADATKEEEDDSESSEVEAPINLPAFLRPKTRMVRRGGGRLVGLTLLSVLILGGGIALGIFEALQMYKVLQNNQGVPAVLQRNSTVWILRLMHWVAPAVLSFGAVLFGFTWGRFWPLPPAEEVVVGAPAKQVQSATPSGPDWQTFD